LTLRAIVYNVIIFMNVLQVHFLQLNCPMPRYTYVVEKLLNICFTLAPLIWEQKNTILSIF